MQTADRPDRRIPRLKPEKAKTAAIILLSALFLLELLRGRAHRFGWISLTITTGLLIPIFNSNGRLKKHALDSAIIYLDLLANIDNVYTYLLPDALADKISWALYAAFDIQDIQANRQPGQAHTPPDCPAEPGHAEIRGSRRPLKVCGNDQHNSDSCDNTVYLERKSLKDRIISHFKRGTKRCI